MKKNGTHIGIVSRDDNLRSVAEVLLNKAGFEVESFRSVPELFSFPAIRVLNGLIIAGEKDDDESRYSNDPTFEHAPGMPVIFLSTFSEESSPDGRVRRYPASFSWKQVLSDLVELIDGNGEQEKSAV